MLHWAVPVGTTGPSYIYIYMWWQPAARGHRAYTDLSAARVWGQSYMHSLQPRQLGNDSLLNMVPIPPLGRCVEGPPLVKLYG